MYRINWKFRSESEVAIDLFNKGSKILIDNGANFAGLTINSGSDDNSFSMIASFENSEMYGDFDDKWVSNPDWAKQFKANWMAQQPIENIHARTLKDTTGNLLENEMPVFVNWRFTHPDINAVIGSFEIGEKYWKEAGSSGQILNQLSGDGMGQFLFAARFQSMKKLGKGLDMISTNENFGDDLKDYFKDITWHKNSFTRLIMKKMK